MDIGITLVNAFVVLAVGTFLTYLTNDRSRRLRDDMRDLRQDLQDLKGEVSGLDRRMLEGFSALRQELRADLARLEARVDAGLGGLRSDLTRVALAVGTERPDAAGGRT